MAWVDVAEDVPPELVPIIYDPQTSGGLLVSLSPAEAPAYVRELQALGHSHARVVGQVLPAERAPGLRVMFGAVEGNGRQASIRGASLDTNALHTSAAANANLEEKTMSEPQNQSCCEGAGGAPAAGADFSSYLKAANEPGLIDKRAKKLMAIALSVAQRCRPCLAIHMKSAKAMGITKPEMDEAANLAIGFAGCPAMMMYKEVSQELGM
jgi:AhpD family alkylhydroperoxidase